MRRRAVGATIEQVRRVAKRVVLELSTGDAFVIEPRMTGMMVLASPPDREHLRVEWMLEGDHEYSSLWFWDRRGLGTVRLYSGAQIVEALGPVRLGCDALEMTESAWQTCVRKTRRPIKVALLDQKLVAGIGNLYASEILHRAGIHPELPAGDLGNAQVRALHASTLEILHEAIRYEGSTLNDGTYRNALNKNGSYQNAHRVYNRQGERCPTCGRCDVVRIVQGQRSTFFCPECQPMVGQG